MKSIAKSRKTLHYNYPFSSENTGITLLNSLISSFQGCPESKLKSYLSHPELKLPYDIPAFIRSRNSIDYFTTLLEDAFGKKWNKLVQKLRRKTESNSYDQRISRFGTKIKTLLIIINGKRYKIILFQTRYIRVIKVYHPDNDVLTFLCNLLITYVYHVCKVELSSDYTGLTRSESMELLEFNRKTLYVKWRGKAFAHNYVTTEYMNNVRNHRSAGVKGYIKNDSFYRLEVTLKTPFLRNLSIERIEDLYKLTPYIVTERIGYRIIDFNTWRNAFHKFPVHNNRKSERRVVNEINRITSNVSLNDAVKYARKYVKPKKEFLKIHPFEFIFKAAIQAPFIENDHPECIRVVQPSLMEPDVDEMILDIQMADLVDETDSDRIECCESLDDCASVGDDSVAAYGIAMVEMIDDCDVSMSIVAPNWSSEMIQHDVELSLKRFSTTEYNNTDSRLGWKSEVRKKPVMKNPLSRFGAVQAGSSKSAEGNRFI